MSGLIRKVHIYLGLLCFSILMVYGITGLAVTFWPAPAERGRQIAEVRQVDFRPPANLDDTQMAEAAWKHLSLPMTSAPPEWAIRRDENNNVGFTLYTPKGVDRVTVLEQEGRLRIESRRVDVWMFLNNLHATTIRSPSTDWRIRAWAWYNEFAIVSLVLMGLMGVYLWISSRPRHRLAIASLVLGCGSFIVLYVVTR